MLVAVLALLPVAAVAIPALTARETELTSSSDAILRSTEVVGGAAPPVPPPPQGGPGPRASSSIPPLTWANLTGVSGASPGRLDRPSLAYDPLTGTDLLFGGGENGPSDGAGDSNATWTFSNGVWAAVQPTASPPNASAATMAFDPEVNAFVLVSPNSLGFDDNPPASTWEFTGGEWSPLSTSVVGGPPGTRDGAMVYDPSAGELVRFGGNQFTANGWWDRLSNATWAFEFGAWVNVTGTREPPALIAPSMAYDPAEHGVVLFGGLTAGSGEAGTNETWLWSNWTWTRLILPWSPPGVTEAQLGWDPAVGGLVLAGGTQIWGSTGPGSIRNTSYAFVNGSWTNFTPAAPFPGAVGAGLGYEATSGSPFLFGGSVDGTTDAFTWMLARDPPVTIESTGAETDVGVHVGFVDPLGVAAPGEQIAWSFGDGTNEIGANATHAFASTGVYAVNLTGSLPGAAPAPTGWAATTVTVLRDPSAWVSLENTFVDVSDYASATATPSHGVGPYNISWSFGDGSYASGAWSVKHRYLAPGNYSLAATVTDSLGGTNTMAIAVHVQPYPWVDLATPQVAYDLGQTIHLQAATQNGSAPFTFSYTGLPPGCPSENVSNYTCEPTGTGAYSVQVTVLDANGVQDTSGMVLVTIAPPLNGTLSLSARVVDLGASVTVGASLASDGSGNASVTVSSLLPCRAVATLEDVCTPTLPGTYIISAVAADQSGATEPLVPTELVVNAALTLNASVPAGPVARGTPVLLSVDVGGGTPPLRVDFESVPDGCYALNATAYRCDFQLAGTYPISASVTDALGNTATTHAEVVVQAPASGVGATPTPVPPSTGSIDYVFWGLVAAAVAEIAMSVRHNRSPDRRWRDRVRKGLWSVFGSAPIDASDADAIPGADAPP
ncbi:MAG: PKD domain-containing protein [Thermoplasmata archaeon]|nr:PKD domain-containing protein [Thermoplasmata archaeon]